MPSHNGLLDRDAFREAVFARDDNKCVVCSKPAVDAHHIIERRLFSDGGYYLDNGASLCGHCHLEAESTILGCEVVRRCAGITRVVLPEHLYSDTEYDKWGNPILAGEQRLKGELFCDESVQKILAAGRVLHLFTDRVKYPRTYHLPWDSKVGEDDRVLPKNVISGWIGEEMVVTLKMDGENTSMYTNGMHARSTDYSPHSSRNRARAIHAAIAHDIPVGWRVCAENMTAVHSIEYTDLPGHLMVFSVWDEKNRCLPWNDTVEWAHLLGLPAVPVLWRGPWTDRSEAEVKSAYAQHRTSHEGFVVRKAGSFGYAEFRHCVGKFVRTNHVQTHGHWMKQAVRFNGIKES